MGEGVWAVSPMVEQSGSGGRGGRRPLALNLQHQAAEGEAIRVYGRLLSSKSVRNSVVRNVLNLAWARFGHVKMKDVDDNTMAFEFESDRAREQILDLSPWSVQGHCLNLRVRNASMSLGEASVYVMNPMPDI